MTPATAPMISAPSGVTVAQGEVMATRPASTPFRVMPTSGFPNLNQATTMAAMPPAQPARNVLTMMRAMVPLAAVVEPALNPNQPRDRMKTPSAAIGRLWPGMARGLPSLPYLPMRGPTTIAPAKAAQPPTECTTVEPAKSMKPHVRQPGAGVAVVADQQVAPGPVPEDGIDDQRDEDAIDQVGGKLGAFGHGAGDDRRRGGREHDLEHPEGVFPLAVDGGVIGRQEEVVASR